VSIAFDDSATSGPATKLAAGAAGLVLLVALLAAGAGAGVASLLGGGGTDELPLRPGSQRQPDTSSCMTPALPAIVAPSRCPRIPMSVGGIRYRYTSELVHRKAEPDRLGEAA